LTFLPGEVSATIRAVSRDVFADRPAAAECLNALIAARLRAALR
jgi:hypothetical protein